MLLVARTIIGEVVVKAASEGIRIIDDRLESHIDSIQRKKRRETEDDSRKDRGSR